MPIPEAQVKLLPAAVPAVPTVALIAVISEVAYVNIHCTPAGSLPEGEVNVRLSVAGPPEAAVADDNAKASVWAQLEAPHKNAKRLR